MGKAERNVNRRHPYVGTTIMAITYSNMPPNDQNNSMTMMIVARLDEGRYSSINVELQFASVFNPNRLAFDSPLCSTGQSESHECSSGEDPVVTWCKGSQNSKESIQHGTGDNHSTSTIFIGDHTE
jgi:hypothetical protein